MRRPDENNGAPAAGAEGPLKIALAGCGAVAQLYYAPALSVLERAGAVSVVAAFDPDPDRCAAFCSRFPRASACRTFPELLQSHAELAVIASPPHLHVEQAGAALRSAMHVLCEKPLATTAEDAGRLIRAAAQCRRLLAVGLIRRHLPATAEIGALLRNGAMGELRRVSCFEGGPFEWPVRSVDCFDRGAWGGGVLQDIGTHCLDLLYWWLGPPCAVDYRDDAMGGVEANCELDLSYDSFELHVRLSRDWRRPNRYIFEGTRGRLAWTVNDPGQLWLQWRGSGHSCAVELLEPDRGDERNGNPVPDFHGCFVRQLRATAAAIREGAPPPVPAEAALDVLKLIERCYAQRRLMHMGWLQAEELARANQLAGTRP